MAKNLLNNHLNSAMDFIVYSNTWAQREVTQGRIMIGVGIILLFVLYSIFRSQNELLKGSLLPLSLLLVILVGYGSYILYSRPAHSKKSIALYEQAKTEAIEQEKFKHINDNKAGKALMRYVYPSLIILAALALLLISTPYYRGMAVGFILLFASTYIIDNGFVSRSDAFLVFLDGIQ
ncbi:MAG: hypothetical protein AAGJ82_05585 [Bacteroidota bacterium]